MTTLNQKQFVVLEYYCKNDPAGESISGVYRKLNLVSGDEKHPERILVENFLIRECAVTKDDSYYDITERGRRIYKSKPVNM